MFFAIDPVCPSVPAEIFEALCTFRAHSTEQLELFALIDAAFDEALLANRRWIRQPKFSLYEHTALHGLAAAGRAGRSLPRNGVSSCSASTPMKNTGARRSPH